MVGGPEGTLGAGAPRPVSSPATEWSCVASSASVAGELRAGSSARRRASIVLPAPGDPTMQQVVTAGRGDLERPPGLRLPADLGEVDPAAGLGHAGSSAATSGGSHVPRRKPDRLGERRAQRPPAARRPARPRRRCAVGHHDDAGAASRAAAIAAESTPGVESTSPSERHLAEERRRRRARGAGTCAVAASDRDGDRAGRARGPPCGGWPGRGSPRLGAAATRGPRARRRGGCGRAPSCTVAPGSPVSDKRRQPSPTNASTATGVRRPRPP